jgi:hypothetical protein
VEQFSFKKGQAFLALVFFIGGIVSVASLLIAFLAASSIDTGYGAAASANAEAAAIAGAEDGLLQLNRDALFPTGSSMSDPYTITPSGSVITATVTITQNSPSSGLTTILSSATVSGHTKNIDVVVSDNATTGQTGVVSWTEIQ